MDTAGRVYKVDESGRKIIFDSPRAKTKLTSEKWRALSHAKRNKIKDDIARKEKAKREARKIGRVLDADFEEAMKKGPHGGPLPNESKLSSSKEELTLKEKKKEKKEKKKKKVKKKVAKRMGKITKTMGPKMLP